MQNWFVIRTRSRWEKKVCQLLTEKGIETFCPLVKQRRQWSDRVKTIELPLFKSYLFVRISEEHRTCVRVTEGVLNFVYKGGKPVVVKEKLILHIRQFQQMHLQVTAINTGQQNEPGRPQNGKDRPATLWIEILDILLIAGLDQPKLIKASTDKH